MSENNGQKIEIKTDGAFSEIYVDGHQLKGVRKYKLEHGLGNIPILTVDLNAMNLSVDGRMLLYQEGYGNITIDFKDKEEVKADWENYPPLEECTDMGDKSEE